VATRGERRYGNPLAIRTKLHLPTPATAAAAAPVAAVVSGTDGIPVTAEPVKPGAVKV